LISITLPTVAAAQAFRGVSHQLVEPTLIDVLPTSEDATRNAEWWSKKTPEECLSLLLDPQSGVGFADTKYWTPLQTSRFADHIEARHLPVILRKVGGAKYGWNGTPGVNIAFNKLSYTKNGVKRLQDITGYFRAGSMVAVIGAPDAGVTTFFDVLTNRHQKGEVTGDVVINGRPRDESFNRQVGYVMKDDIHLPLMTVRETMTFSAKLRWSPIPNACEQVSQVRVDTIIKLLGLRGCANTIIGDGTIRGISGGERRRVTIGNELVAGTQAVLMDLPTNGLDSATAYEIMNSLKQESLGGRSFICSLAQPSPELLGLFDTIMILSKGSCIYFGPRHEVISYLAALGFHCPIGKPVPEFLEELSAVPHRFYGPAPTATVSTQNNKEVKEHGDVAVTLPVPTLAAVAGYVPPTPSVNTGMTMEAAWTTLVQAYQRSVTFENVKAEVARELESGKTDSDKVKVLTGW
jgi:ABC-type multidrug transport system ATPase subunit